MKVPAGISDLVSRFQEYREQYESPEYVEARVRVDFINPFFECLGWDVANRLDRPERGRDVITEGRVRVGLALKAPDYVFRAGGVPRFVVEAKKPSLNLKEAVEPALQLRRYGWNAKDVGVGILTDFQELAVYDTRVEPHPTDKADTALIDYFTFEDYHTRWPEIADRFSRDAVTSGALDAYVATFPKKRGTRVVDEAFLQELEAWRAELASDLARRNKLSNQELNEAVHLIIDRIVFLRVCEDRGVESYGQLNKAVGRPKVYEELVHLFRRADEKFNSGLFHFRNEPGRRDPDELTPELRVGQNVLRDFVTHLYWPQGPYDFSVLDPSVLGQVYEQFLGSVIRLRGPKKAVVEEKPEVRKAGGVYYTPTHVVHHIVSSVLKPRLAATDPVRMRKRPIRVLDPACGSGSFLMEVYQTLLDWYLEWYVANDVKRWAGPRQRKVIQGADGSWKLAVAERKRILLVHVYGVDIDPQATEVTKLSLLLKVLEGESEDTLHEQLALFHERALPDLDSNVKDGNSLVGSSFHQGQGMFVASEEARSINAFDWQAEFPEAMAAGGFDVVVGNPPWLMAGYYVQPVMGYLRENFRSATGKFDLYYLFLEQCLRLVSSDGAVGMIVPNKFFHTGAAKELRSILATSGRLHTVEDFGVSKLFRGATNYSAILLLDKVMASPETVYERRGPALEVKTRYDVGGDELSSDVWLFQHPRAKRIYEKMCSVGVPLETVCARFGTGVQTGADRLLTFTSAEARDLGLERELLRPLLRGRDVRAFRVGDAPKVVIFPYVEDGDDFHLMSARELSKYPRAWKYLKQHESKLDERVWFGKNATELSGDWYGFMYVDRAKWFNAPHILTPSLSSASNFARGNGHLFVTGTAGVTSIVPMEGMDIKYLLGLLNSRLLSLFAVDHSPMFQGGYRKFSAPYLKQLPIKVANADSSTERVAEENVRRIVDALTELERLRAGTSSAKESGRLHRLIEGLRLELDELVAGLYGMSESDRVFVSSHVANLAATA